MLTNLERYPSFYIGSSRVGNFLIRLVVNTILVKQIKVALQLL
jgi:hypothetical protein